MDNPIHVNRDQVTIGVFSEAQISAGLGQGSITPNDLCWTEGMKEWKTIREAYPHLSPSASAAPPSGIPLMPSRPGQPSANYASGGDRFGAYLLDGLFMGLISCGLIVPVVIVLVVSADTDIAQMAQAFRSAANLIGVFVGCFISLLMSLTLIADSDESTTMFRISAETLKRSWRFFRIDLGNHLQGAVAGGALGDDDLGGDALLEEADVGDDAYGLVTLAKHFQSS